MPLSPVQKGAVGQFAFLATALVTGKGQVEIYTPAMDNEGRDAEIRRHLKSTPGISIQVKVSLTSPRKLASSNYLALRFALAENRIQNDPRLWYFCARYDPDELRLHDPVFLIPSRVFHKLARRPMWAGRIRFVMMANMAPDSRDQWSPYRLAPAALGKHLLKIIDEMPLTTSTRPLKVSPDSLWLARTRWPVAGVRRNRAA